MAKKKNQQTSTQSVKNKPNKITFPFLKREDALNYFCLLLIGITTVIMAWWSWGTWCDAMIDFGRELYVPWQLTEGRTLFTDIAYFNGPLSPYFNSIVFLLFGVHLRSILLINFLILTAILFFSYKMLKEIGSRTGATLGCLIIITVFAFAKYHFIGSYNFIAPYSHEMTHGLLLSLIALWCLSNYQRKNKNAFILVSGILMGCVFLTKVEFTIAAAISLISGFLLILWLQKEPRKPAVFKLILFLTGVIVPPGIAFLLLYASMPALQALSGVLGSWVGTLKPELRNMTFYQEMMGIDQLGMNIKIVFAGFGCLVLIFLPAVSFSLMSQIDKKRNRIIGLTLLTGAVLTSIFLINPLISFGPFMLRPLPLVLVSLIIIEAIHLHFQRRENAHTPVTILRLTVLIFALLLLIKIILKADPSQYGFALAMPGTLMMASALVDWLPAFLEQKGKVGAILRLFSIGIIIIFAGIHVLWSGFWYNKTNVKIKTDTAEFYTDFRGNSMKEVIKEIENHASPQDTLAVLPEGVMLNFLLQRNNPTPYINFMPPEFVLFGESNMLKAFQANPPDYIVLTNKSLMEYGFQEAGVDIGIELYQWIDKQYSPIKQIGTESESNLPFTSMRLLRRMQHPSSSHSKPDNG